MKGRPKGYKPTEEQLANMRKPRKNTDGMKKPKSEETKAKMLVAQQIRRAREKQAKAEIHNTNKLQ